jgi:hypothetical protein
MYFHATVPRMIILSQLLIHAVKVIDSISNNPTLSLKILYRYASVQTISTRSAALICCSHQNGQPSGVVLIDVAPG